MHHPHVTPLNNFLLVKPVDTVAEKTTESGIILAETHKLEDRPTFSEVVAVPKELKEAIKVGARIHHQRLGPVPVKVEDVEYFYVAWKDVLGVYQA